MASDDDARPSLRKIAAAAAAGLLTLVLIRYLLTDDWTVAGMFGFAAAQLVAELFSGGDDGPSGGSPAEEISPPRA